MKKIILYTLLIPLILFPQWVSAQTEVSFDMLEIALWPEFDSPEMLVIYRFLLSPDTVLPATVSIPIPTAVGEPHAVAYLDEAGSLINAEYSREVGAAGVSMINITLDSLGFQLEYYDPRLGKTGTNRHYEFTWAGGYPVDAYKISVQQPFDTSSMNISPSLEKREIGEFELEYYRGVGGSLLATEGFQYTIDYEKPSETLSVDGGQSGQIPTTPTAATPGLEGGISLDDILKWGLGILAVISTAAAVYFYSRRSIPPDGEQSYPTSVSSPSITPIRQTQKSIFCQQCGTQCYPEDSFCRKCGIELSWNESRETVRRSDILSLEKLSKREIEVLKLVAEGLTSPLIGEQLGISANTVSRHRERIMKKIEMRTISELIKFAIRTGMIEL
jgi:DNA-binding CsgD family transcriptional regulator